MDPSGEKQSKQKQLLSPNIKLFGDILGEVLKDQAGEKLFELEENIRHLAKRYREQGDGDAFVEMQEILSGITMQDKTTIIKAFSHFFKLVNLAEEYYKIKINKEKESAPSNTNNLTYAMKFAKDQNLEINQLEEIFNKIHIQMVWTSHPTEARRLTIMMKLRTIYDLLTEIQNYTKDDHEYRKIRHRIKEQITLLWQTDELREDKIELLDEVRTVLWYFDNTLFEVVPDMYRHLIEHLQGANYPAKPIVELPKFLEFGSWVGGDRDGHPGVTADVTIQTLLLQKRLCLRKYRQAIESLIKHLSSSTNFIEISDELKESIVRDESLFPDFSAQTRGLNKREPYRRKLDFIRLKVENALKLIEQDAEDIGLGHTLVGYSEDDIFKDISNYYNRSREFYEDLQLLYNSLMENNGEIIANGLLTDLIIQVQVFGFHLAPLDLRQDADVHLATMQEIFDVIGLEDLSILTKKEQCEVFLRELRNQRPLGISAIQRHLSERSNEIIKTLRVAMDSINRISPRSMKTYIISMSTHERDVLLLMLLMKEVGLLEIDFTDDKLTVTKAYLDIAPLFETKEDLENAPEVMNRLFTLDLYKSYIGRRDDIQEIMIGYSDSTKDVGIIESNFQLITAQQDLEQITRNHGYQIRIFHGRGGSVSRGGGPTNRALLSLPPKTVFNVKITEQGEVIGQNYANKEIAQSHLEGIISAMIVRGISDTYLPIEQISSHIEEKDMKAFGNLANTSCSVYEQMVKHNNKFIPFYMQFTPLDLIERATIGSRPSRRTKNTVSNINALRAIPWVFSWTQTRLIFPGYYGLGTALKQIKNENGLDQLQDLYRNFPYFRSMINNIQMVLLKADMQIAELYLRLLPDNQKELEELFQKIRDEYELAKQFVLEISNCDSLMAYAPDTANSIKRRNPYLDPLSVLQVNLMQEWREAGKPNSMKPNELQRILLQTVNGIAAGLKNTG